MCSHCIDNITGHIDACLLQSAAVTGVIIVVPTFITLPKIRRLIDGDPALVSVLDRIEYEGVEPYMKELFG